MSTPQASTDFPGLAPTLCDVEHLVGAYEIGRMLGVSRQRVFQLTSRPDFPKPTVELAAGKVWITAEVVAWAQGQGRVVRESDE